MTSKTLGELYDAAGKGYEPLPAGGPYRVEVTKVDFEHKPDKNPGFVLSFTVTEGALAKRKINFVRIVLGESEGSSGYFFSKMAALGLDKEFWSQYREASIDDLAPTVAQALIGAQAFVYLSIREYQGKLNNDVTSIKSVSDTTVVQLPTVPQAGNSTNIPPLPAGL